MLGLSNLSICFEHTFLKYPCTNLNNYCHFSQIPETSKLPLPIVPRRPHPRVNLTQKDLGERVLVFGEKRGILRYIGKFLKH